MKEINIQNLIRLELSKIGAIVFRNNVGLFLTEDGRKIRTGLCIGSADLIGWYKGKFLAIEVKQPGKNATPDQQNFINQVNDSGGIAFVAHSVDEAVKELNTWK